FRMGFCTLSVMVQEIWDKDVNRLKPGTDYRISLQVEKLYKRDYCITHATLETDLHVLFQPLSLLDNSESDTGEPETVTPDEEAENHKFLDYMLRMPTMKVSRVEKQWCSMFQPHNVLPCSSRPDSSGFEHVFVGETRGGRTVIGFHNWIQLYLQENITNDSFSWMYVFIVVSLFSLLCQNQPDENKHNLALQFSWKNGIKPKGSIFVGVSPEFEFALYTLCFLFSPNERVSKHIGTTYPVLVKYQNEEKN
uniref:Uridylate-specific endoribonuclease n=1 Tax=Salmo trutta TaxID=8032 RepID=A0A673WWJ1_SALTR